jgi:hypothetical protein
VTCCSASAAPRTSRCSHCSRLQPAVSVWRHQGSHAAPSRAPNVVLLHADVWWSLCTIGLMCRCVSETIFAGALQIEYEDILLVSDRPVFCPALYGARSMSCCSVRVMMQGDDGALHHRVMVSSHGVQAANTPLG